MSEKNASLSALSNYNLVCGMEIHAELKTRSKMFCGCKNDPFHAPQPNVYTCPVCLGLPGALPVANKRAIEWTIKIGLALNCEINLFSKFDRKNYFYPDLPKGYQISQYDLPFCKNGYIETSQGKVRIRRIHLEEDTAKLQHKTVNGQKVSLIDFNRSSVPLVEIVTEPDIHTPEQAKEYGKKIRQLLQYLDVADCDMEQGGMRLEANISLRAADTEELPSYKVEVKNINSFRFLEKAIAYEMKRQAEVLADGETPVQETRGWNDNKGETFSQRVKEDAEDYRYFPDPDLPPVRFTEKYIEELRGSLPDLPEEVKERWNKDFNVEAKYAEVLTEDKSLSVWAEELFTAARKAGLEPNAIANAVVNKKVAYETAAQNGSNLLPSDQVISAFQLLTKTDTIDPQELQTAIDAVINENQDAVAQYKAGKTQILGFFMGQVQRKLGKKVDVKLVSEQLRKTL